MTTRRDFLAGLGAFALLPLARTEPELILYNGNLWTVDPLLPRAQAVAISGGRFLAVGSNDDVLHLAAGRSRKIDLGGKAVLPGFNDAHSHPVESGVEHLRMVACDKDSILAIQSALRQRAGKTPAGQWVLGFLYDDGKTPRPLSRQDLDATVPDHPVLVRHRGGHTVFVNSMALKLAGVDEKTPDPPGGRFEHDSAGQLTGHVGDRATAVFEKLIAYKPTRDDYRAGAKLISQMMTSKGVTSACDADATPEDLQGYQDARDAGELKGRFYTHIDYGELDKMIAAGLHTGFGDEWVRVGAVKLFADGSISERTALLTEPYVGLGDYRGISRASRETLYAQARKAYLAGWQVGTHANGDVAIDTILGVYEQLLRESPRRDPRLRIEHCTLVTPDLVRRIKTAGVIPLPFAGYVRFHGEKMHFYGEERLKHMFAMRDFLDAGVKVAPGSDYTASPAEPMLWLQSEVTRTDASGHTWGANQRITVEEAIRCSTVHGAYASFEEGIKGALEPGQLADLVVWDHDLLRIGPESLMRVKPERTMLGGRWVYEA